MSLFWRIVDHIQYEMSLSKISMSFMSLCILLMASIFLIHIFYKKDSYERNISITGVIVRGLIIIAFTLEFYHQTSISSYMKAFADKESSLMQFVNFIFFAYIVVVGVYDILTIHINKYRGFFHTFDIAVMAIPMILWLTPLTIESFRNFQSFYMIIWVLYLFIGLCLYMFFQMYWRADKRLYLAFFIVDIVIIFVSILAFSQPYEKRISVFTPLSVFLLLLAIYEVSRIIFKKANDKINKNNTKRFAPVLILVPILLVAFANPWVNIFTISSNNKVFEQVETYREGAYISPYSDIERRVKLVSGLSNEKLNIFRGTKELFNNIYTISIDDLRMSISGTSGKLRDLNRISPIKETGDKIASENEIKDLALQYINRAGYTFNDKLIEMDISLDKDDNHNYVVYLYKKYSDGTKLVPEHDYPSMTFDKYGRIQSINLGTLFFNLKDYKEINISMDNIQKAVDIWYEKLGRNSTPYVFEYNDFVSYSKPYAELILNFKNGEKLTLNSQNAEVIEFNEPMNKEIVIENEAYNEKLPLALNIVQKLYDNWNINDFKQIKYSNNQSYVFVKDKGLTNRYIELRLDEQGKILSYKNTIRVKRMTIKNNKIQLLNDYGQIGEGKPYKILISRNKALSVVEDRYKAFHIYNERIKPAVVFDQKGNGQFKWLVVIIPYKTNEHHVYFIDGISGEITSVGDYKAGVKNE